MVLASSVASASGIAERTPAQRAEHGVTAMFGNGAASQRLEAFLRMGPFILDHLETSTTVRFSPPPAHPDYKDLLTARSVQGGVSVSM
jgi:hypothetical protein